MHVKATIRRNVQFLVEAGYIAGPTGQKMKYMANRVFQRTWNAWENVKRLSIGVYCLFYCLFYYMESYRTVPCRDLWMMSVLQT